MPSGTFECRRDEERGEPAWYNYRHVAPPNVLSKCIQGFWKITWASTRSLSNVVSPRWVLDTLPIPFKCALRLFPSSCPCFLHILHGSCCVASLSRFRKRVNGAGSYGFPPLTLSSWRRPSHGVLCSCWTSGCRVSLTQEELPGFLSASHLRLVIRNIKSHLVTSAYTLHCYSLDISFAVYGTSAVKLTGATQDRLFDHVAARHHLLEAFGPLLQEPLPCHHLQLPANTTSVYYWTHRAASSVLKMKNLNS